MDILLTIDALAAIAGLVLAVIVCVSPRLGTASRGVSLFAMSGGLCSAFLAAGQWQGSVSGPLYMAFACLMLAAAGGCITSYAVGSEQSLTNLVSRRLHLILVVAFAAAAAAYLLVHSDFGGSANRPEVVVGPVGHYAALYLIVAAVIALAKIEQTLRSAEEHVRWEIKFLVFGVASAFGAIVYVASMMLQYPTQVTMLWRDSLHIFPFVFLLSCGLIAQSWRRSSGRSRVIVSQGVIYSSITLIAVGGYLILAGLVTRWASRLGLAGVPTEPLLFILAIVVLLTFITGTAFRHRVKRWIRQHVLAGRYDYRRLWMEASQHVLSADAVGVPADGLAELVHGTLGSLEISVWARRGASDAMRLVAVRGMITDSLPAELTGIVSRLAGISEPVAVSELENDLPAEWPEDILRQTKASLVVPLVSAEHLVGFITVGADRSGKPFDWETREFLRVLAVHFAGEFHKSELLSQLVESRETEAFRMFSTFLLHDLKNFAATLSLIANNASRHHANPSFQLDAFQSIVDISEKMKRLCNSLRTFSTTLAGNKQWHAMTEILESVAHGFETSTGRPVELRLAAVPRVFVDRDEIARLVQNLVLNAHEASADGRAIRLSCTHDQRGIVISVTDRGSGISEGFLRAGLFHPFRTTKADGLGIGLFHSKKIVEAHSGTIEVTSVEGRGTTVRVILPLQSPAGMVQVSSLQPDRSAVTTRTEYPSLSA